MFWIDVFIGERGGEIEIGAVFIGVRGGEIEIGAEEIGL